MFKVIVILNFRFGFVTLSDKITIPLKTNTFLSEITIKRNIY